MEQDEEGEGREWVCWLWSGYGGVWMALRALGGMGLWGWEIWICGSGWDQRALTARNGSLRVCAWYGHAVSMPCRSAWLHLRVRTVSAVARGPA